MNENDSPPANQRNTLREALLDLAYDAHSYLRHHARSAVRISAALLIAASLAACSPSGVGQGFNNSSILPLSSEVRTGLPTTPGHYPIVANSLGRDQQGTYHFAWRQPSDPATTRNLASASLVQLAQGPTGEIEIPAQGDPILSLPADAAIPLVDSVDQVRNGAAYNGYYPYWHPFYGGYRGSGYYDPPSRTVSGSSVDGASVSKSPAPAAARVVGLSRAVSGKAGGSGAGTAATTKSGASVDAASAVKSGGAAAAKSGSFSAGSAGSSVGSSSS